MEQESHALRDTRCIQCRQGHRICSRTKPCKLCIGARRADECVYPGELPRDPKEARKRKREQSGDFMEVRENPYAEKSARSFNSHLHGLVQRPFESSSALSSARTQIYRQQEKVPKTNGKGFMVPRLRVMNPNERTLEPRFPGNNMNVNTDQPMIDPRLLVKEHRIRRGIDIQAKANGTASTGSDCAFPLFENQTPYTLDGASTAHPCMEFRNTGNLCYQPFTFPCEEDHSEFPFYPHAVCHDCRLTPDMYDVNAEEEMIAKNRIYFCNTCTDIRATGPEVQLWEHPRRPCEIVNRKANKCSCHAELQKEKWICGRHRVQKAQYIKKWGHERMKSFKAFFDGDYCACCRIAVPQTDGPTVMWQCAYCQDIVVLEQEKQGSETLVDTLSQSSGSNDDTLP